MDSKFNLAGISLLGVDLKTVLSFQQSTLTGLVTHTFRCVSLRECQQPAPTLASSDKNLRPFTFGLHDLCLAEQRAKEAFAGPRLNDLLLT